MKLPLPASADPDGERVLERLYREHHMHLWRALGRLGVEAAEVDDALQDVFLVAHRRLPDFEGRSTVPTWLFAIALRVARRYRERASRRARPELLEAMYHGDSPEQAAAQSEALRLLDGLLGQLRPEQREVFVLAEVERMTAPEIAEVSGLKLNTVYSRLRLAREAFEKAWARQKARTRRSGDATAQ